MTKRNIGDEIIQGMEDAVKYMHGKKVNAIAHKVEITKNINAKTIRMKLKLARQKVIELKNVNNNP